MQALAFLMLITFIGAMAMSPNVDSFRYEKNESAIYADNMLYYQAVAEALCERGLTYNTGTQQDPDDVKACPSGGGTIVQPSRAGASSTVAYGKAFLSWTDGTSYIVTVSQPQGSMRWQDLLGHMLERMDKRTDGVMAIGRWNASTGKVDMLNVPSSSVVYSKSVDISAGAPSVTFYDGMPVLVTRYTPA